MTVRLGQIDPDVSVVINGAVLHDLRVLQLGVVQGCLFRVQGLGLEEVLACSFCFDILVLAHFVLLDDLTIFCV